MLEQLNCGRSHCHLGHRCADRRTFSRFAIYLGQLTFPLNPAFFSPFFILLGAYIRTYIFLSKISKEGKKEKYICIQSRLPLWRTCVSGSAQSASAAANSRSMAFWLRAALPTYLSTFPRHYCCWPPPACMPLPEKLTIQHFFDHAAVIEFLSKLWPLPLPPPPKIQLLWLCALWFFSLLFFCCSTKTGLGLFYKYVFVLVKIIESNVQNNNDMEEMFSRISNY